MKDFFFLHMTEFIVLILIGSIIVNILLRFQWTKKTILAIIDDTLKVNDGAKRRYSGTKLTMLVAFASVLWCFHYVIIKYGFETDNAFYAFVVMGCIATGVSITGALSKRWNPPAETKPEEPKPEQPVEVGA